MSHLLNHLIKIIKDINIKLNFTLIEIGALKVNESTEPFYDLIKYFPGSKIIGFEIDEDVCKKMNLNAPEGVVYYPHALGKENEVRDFYITNHPMCSSLYKPNEKLISLYNNFEVAYLKKKSTIKTTRLDDLIKIYDIDDIDFIKIDVQGAELDIFKGAKESLDKVLKIVSEVEFIPHYEKQPLFGEICSFLDDHGFMFNKFLGLAGRSLKPIILNNDYNFPSQHIWSDATFIKKPNNIILLKEDRILKLALLSAIYDSPDLVYFCLSQFDKKNSSNLASKFMNLSKNE